MYAYCQLKWSQSTFATLWEEASAPSGRATGAPAVSGFGAGEEAEMESAYMKVTYFHGGNT